MCGIAGVFAADGTPIDKQVVASMMTALAHRGPDGQGVVVDGAVGLGHRRLAILDLTDAGRQPMETPDGSLVITYSGEAYNHVELRSELEALGHQFRSRTDTEVVLHAYQEWGPEAVERLNGMFAFAIWDRRNREMFLARDRYGIKPLYTTWVGETFLFSSEIKAFMPYPGFEVRLSPAHLVEYFTFQNIFTDGTLFAGVNLLPAGTWARVRAGSAVEQVRYWDFSFAGDLAATSKEEAAEELRRLFEQAVRRQLMSDVPVGSYLSGGMDSGSITAIAARQIPYLSTFTGGFDLTSASGLELGFDERADAEALSYLCKTEHYEVVLKAGDMERCLRDLVWHLEDLRVGQSYPNFYVARLASKFVKVVLAGTGGDELFGGYPWRYYDGSARNYADYVTRYFLSWNRLVPAAYAHNLFGEDISAAVSGFDPLDVFRDVLGSSPGDLQAPEDYISRSLYFEAKTFLHGLLVVEDKLSMAHGLETRVPFLDNDLVEFAQALPVKMKIRDLETTVRLDENELGSKVALRHQQTRDGKMLLREALRGIVPAASVRPKQGFSGPDASWFRGDSIDFITSTFIDNRARVYDYLQPGTVRALLSEHISGRHNRRLFIWSLLMFETWLETFMPDGSHPIRYPTAAAGVAGA